MRDEAAFAKLAASAHSRSPPATATTHRLNPADDRHLNRALHTIADSRITPDPRTRDYLARHTSEGLGKRRVRGCLKLYIAREIYGHPASGRVDNP
ncbi:hypothetical protein AB0B12_32000 [Streptomyces sp. NPDC044780]|uniref:hypothetical protein n=1 Tax=unclassified Streptomyces TaxID=2593676 RepID=UPI0033D73E9C